MFGALTKKAVIRFQEKYASDILMSSHLNAGTGLVGAATRAKLNALCVQISTPPPAPVAAPAATSSSTPLLLVSIPAQPLPTLAPANALYVPATAVTLTAQGGDVTVNDMSVERIGASSDDVISYLSLLDQDGGDLSDTFLHADHQATFPDSFTIPAGTSMTVTVTANMAIDLTDFPGEQFGFAIKNIDATAPLVGALPASGTLQTTNAAITIGTALATISSFDPMANASHYISDKNVRFSGIRVAAGPQEDLTMHSISWRMSGTASLSDLSNLTVYVNGTPYPTTVDDKQVTADFGSGIPLLRGNAADIYIQGDIGVGAANQTVQFDIEYPTDVSLTGNTFGYGIYLLPGGNTATSGGSVFLTSDGTTDTASLTPFFAGSPTSVEGATFIQIGR
jgi:hypothetical protein